MMNFTRKSFAGLFLFMVMGFFSQTLKAQTVSTGALPFNTLCPCNTYQVVVTSTGTFGFGNVYTAQLSDATGSFATPTPIGTLNSAANSGIINCTIPCNTPTGTQYRVRVVSSSPAVTGSNNGSNLTITQNPNAPVSAASNPAALCLPGGTVQLTAQSPGNFISWYNAPTGGSYLGGTPSGGNFTTSLSNTTTYYAEALVGGIATTGTATFSYTGAMQTFTVPQGITSLSIQCYGASGANGVGVGAGSGGLGAMSSGNLSVTPGQTINIFVGGAGTNAAGGWNGGGNPGSPEAGGGGGASDVRTNGTALANRVITAGGGGGGGAPGCPVAYAGGNGGAGGGGLGFNGANSPTGGAGFGGSIGVGGLQGAGCGSFVGAPGTVPNGGAGQAIGCAAVPSGGGGGGGFVQGGGGGGGSLGTVACSGNDKGAGGGGAGGTNDVTGVTNTTMTSGVNSGNGQVVITWNGSPSTCASGTRTPVVVTVNPIPTVTASPTATTVCPNTLITLSGNGASTYVWNGPQAIQDGVPFAAVTSGIYTVTGTSAAGCTSTATAIVNVYNVTVTASATPATNICIGSSLTLNGGGAVSYAWTGGVNNGVSFVPPLGTNTYTVTGTDANSCTKTSVITINVNDNPLPPTAVASNPASLCVPGGSIQLTGTAVGSTINWFTTPAGGTLLGNSPSAGNFNTTTATTTTYYAEATLTGVNNCVSTTRTPIQVVVNPLPVVSASPTNAQGCNNVNVSLNGSGANTYTWAGPQSIQNGVPFIATITGTYTVTGTDVNGCTSTATAFVQVNPLPNVSASANPGTTICQGDPVTLSGSGAVTYIWSGGATNNVPTTPATTTAYTVTGADAIGCTKTSTILITVNPADNPIVALNSNPSVAIVGNNTSFIATVPISTTAYQLDWYKNNTFFTTTFNPTNSISFVPTSPADSVYAIMTPLAGCYNPDFIKSNSVLIRFTSDVAGVDVPENFLAYPNPSNGLIYLQGTEAGDALAVTDISGRVLIEKTLNGQKEEVLNLSNMSSGIYFGRVVRNGKLWVIKMVKQ
ncbi:MAG: T9SS type A sorting domain-containing protein [Chitinophagaceae bacterium]